MNSVASLRAIHAGPLLFGLPAVLFLTACATTTQSPGGDDPKNTGPVEIGYGTTSPDRVVGAASTIRGEELHAGQPKTLADMLARIPGVRVIDMVEGGLSVRIRGSSSFVGSEEPLFVIDGMAMYAAEGGIGELNPNSIESITVLKDADATAIYGSRGANGVILIKTRGG